MSHAHVAHVRVHVTRAVVQIQMVEMVVPLPTDSQIIAGLAEVWARDDRWQDVRLIAPVCAAHMDVQTPLNGGSQRRHRQEDQVRKVDS